MSVQPLVIERHFSAPPQRVFAAFVETGLMQAWYGPQDMTIPRCDIDARVGGAYRIEMHRADGHVAIVTGKFTQIDSPRRLAFTWGWLSGAGRNPETIVELTFTERNGGTDLKLVQSGFLEEDHRQGHQEGWASALEGLSATLAGNPKPTIAAPTLLGVAASSYVRAARIAFEEKGIAYQLQPSRPHSPEILTAHPWGLMPALRLGERTLFETSAILRYVDETYPGPALMPADPFSRAEVEQWISAFNAYLDRAFVRDYVIPSVFPSSPDGKPERAKIDAATPALRKGLDILDQVYAAREWLVGDGLTLADIIVAPSIAFLLRIPESAEILGSYRNVRRAHAAMAARPSFKATEPS